MSARKRVIVATSSAPTRFAISLCSSASYSKTPKTASVGSVNEVFVAQAFYAWDRRSRVSLTNAFARHPQIPCALRSEERRVGKECRSRWEWDDGKKKSRAKPKGYRRITH